MDRATTPAPISETARSAAPRRRAAILMSGTGSNARVLLEHWRNGRAAYFPAVLFSDRPDRCPAAEIAREYGLPFVSLDIFRFYRERGENGIALNSGRRREIRNEWSCAAAKLLAPYAVDLILLAGFVPLTNLTQLHPCLNVHPGDLTVEENGRRIFAGLHLAPVELALLRGAAYLRSSVILAQPYTGSGEAEMDSGPVIGVSEKITPEYCGWTPETLRRIHANRPERLPANYADDLSNLAKLNIDRLKRLGDHIVFPAAADAFAAGRFRFPGDGAFEYCDAGVWRRVRTVEFSAAGGVAVTE